MNNKTNLKQQNYQQYTKVETTKFSTMNQS